MADSKYRVAHAFYARSTSLKEDDGKTPKKVFITRANQHQVAEHLSPEAITQNVEAGNLVEINPETGGVAHKEGEQTTEGERARFLSTAPNSNELVVEDESSTHEGR